MTLIQPKKYVTERKKGIFIPGKAPSNLERNDL